jgi:hypothetical protein
MLLIWCGVYKISVNHHSTIATQRHDGQFAHGAYAQIARRAATAMTRLEASVIPMPGNSGIREA